MKYTLLQMVQSILISMGSDEVTAITDTVEATDVANIVRDNYVNIVSHINAPENYTLFELTETSSSSPTKMSLPSGFDSLIWLKYNAVASGDTAPNFKDIEYKDLKDFIDMSYHLNTEDSNVGTYDITISSDTITVLYQNDRAPMYYTTYNDGTILFDAYDSAVETYLKKTKTIAYGLQIPSFTISDAFVPTLDEHLFPLLLNESKAQCFAEIKQMSNANAERKAKRSWINSQKTKRNINREYDRLAAVPNYGRKR